MADAEPAHVRAGMAVAHLCNLALAMLLTVRTADPCVWYFINVVFDTTVGTTLHFGHRRRRV